MNESNYWRNAGWRMMSRRRVLTGGAAAGAGLAAIAAGACGDDDDNRGSSTQPSGGGPGQGSASAGDRTPDLNAAIRSGVQADSGNLDPMSVGGASNNPNLVHFIGPVVRDPKTSEAKGYGVDFQWVDNNKALQLTVKPGIKFHNGEVLNAEQVKFTLDRARGAAEYNPTFQTVRKAFYAAVGDVRVVDDRTVLMEMIRPDVWLPYNMGSTYFVPKGLITQQGDDAFARMGVGAGPFKLISRTPDTGVQSERFDEFFYGRDQSLAPRLPFIKRLSQLVRPEPQSRAAALEAGEIDVAADLTSDVAKTFANKKGFKVFYRPAGQSLYGAFNNRLEKDPATGGPNPFRDIRVRKAVNMAVDVDTIIKTILTGNEVPNYGILPSALGYPPDITNSRMKFDPAGAKALLAQAGFPNGFSTDLRYGIARVPTADIAAPAIAKFLTDVGIKTTVKALPFDQHSAAFIKRDEPGIWLFGNSSENALQLTMYSKGQYAMSYYPALDIDTHWEKQASEFDDKQRQATLRQTMTKWYQNASWLFLWDEVRPIVSRDTIEWDPVQPEIIIPEYWAMKVY